jgi:putative ABC transport system ATP-binding protein
MTLLRVEDLVVEYRTGDYPVRVLDELQLTATDGELIVLLGPSGCGKTTLLSCLGGILTPTSGRIEVHGTDVTALKGSKLAAYRRSGVGIVFQSFNLVPSLTARENVAMPLLATGTGRRRALARADELLASVDMTDRAHARPGKLSGGQQQRVAVARALAHDPPLILADEPTANLDYIQAEGIVRLLRELRDDGRIIIVSTHDDRLVPVADRVVHMIPEFRTDGVAVHRVEYATQESIFEQGSRGELVYVIEAGEVDIVRVHADGSEEGLATLGPGRYFGELGPLLGFPRSASARARTDVVLTAYSAQEFRREILHDPLEAAREPVAPAAEPSGPPAFAVDRPAPAATTVSTRPLT